MSDARNDAWSLASCESESVRSIRLVSKSFEALKCSTEIVLAAVP